MPGLNSIATSFSNLEETIKPVSASSIASLNRTFQGNLPYCSCAFFRPANTPGTPTDLPPTTAFIQGIARPFSSKNISLVAAEGAVSLPSKVVNFCDFLSQCNINAPPPIPEDCGSTKVNTNCTAIAASTALPPCFSILKPALLA